MSNQIVKKNHQIDATIDQVDKDNLTYVKRHNSTTPIAKRTLKVYTHAVALFNEFLQEHSYTVNKETVRQFLKMLKEKYPPATAKLYKHGLKKAILNQFGRFNVRDRMVIKEIFDSVAMPTPNKSVSKSEYLNEIEVRDLIRKAGKKTKLIICFLFKTAVRITELINIKLVDGSITRNDKVRIRIIGKGSKERYVVISKELYDKIREVYDGKNYLFESVSGNKLDRSNVSHQIKRTGKKLGWKISAHSLRHSRATDLNRKGFSLYEIKNFLGHSRVDTIENMYLHDEIDAAKIDQKDNFSIADFEI